MNLRKIVSNVQNISEAISSVINVDVTVVDNKLNRIAGTGCYKLRIGETVSDNSVFGFALRQGESFIIENPGEHSACLKCNNISNCDEYAEVCCPIKVGENIVGVIGLIAFGEDQKKSIVSNQSNLIKFLNKMADLISSKFLEQENTDKIKLLARELEIVLDSVDKGIIAVDNEGQVLRYNKKAIQLFKINENIAGKMNIRDFIRGFDFTSIINKSIGVKNIEFVYDRDKHGFRGVFDASIISLENKKFGVLFTFSNLSEVLNIVNDITTGNIMTRFEDIIGNSILFKNVKLEAERAAISNSTILIQGESGTGKELFARAIHFHSYRNKGPFIPINCAAIPEQLLESELFGYEEGAFTGAIRGGKAGKFELANKGTIFLDEIGDMPLHLQTKLLRVLQDHVIEKVGGKERIPIDVRIIAATNKDLEKRVLDGEFRQDLFYRINVIPINIPPLKNRLEDIFILVEYLLEKCNDKLGKHIISVDENVYNTFKKYQWPGNVRELENTIEYAVNMCNSNVIKEQDLPNRLIKVNKVVDNSLFDDITPIKDLEKREIEKALLYFKEKNQSITYAANALGISRATLYRKLKEYKIKTT